MNIYIDGMGNRGLRHGIADIDIARMRVDPTTTSGRYIDMDKRFGLIELKPAVTESGGDAIRITRVVNLKTNGDYRLFIDLTAKDVMFLAWVIARDRSIGWIAEQFARFRQTATRTTPHIEDAA